MWYQALLSAFFVTPRTAPHTLAGQRTVLSLERIGFESWLSGAFILFYFILLYFERVIRGRAEREREGKNLKQALC